MKTWTNKTFRHIALPVVLLIMFTGQHPGIPQTKPTPIHSALDLPGLLEIELFNNSNKTITLPFSPNYCFESNHGWLSLKRDGRLFRSITSRIKSTGCYCHMSAQQCMERNQLGMHSLRRLLSCWPRPYANIALEPGKSRTLHLNIDELYLNNPKGDCLEETTLQNQRLELTFCWNEPKNKHKTCINRIMDTTKQRSLIAFVKPDTLELKLDH